MKQSEAAFIKQHQKAFDTALAKATMVVRTNPRLVGLDKIRVPLAFAAALRALNFEGAKPGFSIPKGAGEPTQDVQDVVDAVFTAAVEAATPQPISA